MVHMGGKHVLHIQGGVEILNLETIKQKLKVNNNNAITCVGDSLASLILYLFVCLFVCITNSEWIGWWEVPIWTLNVVRDRSETSDKKTSLWFPNLLANFFFTG